MIQEIPMKALIIAAAAVVTSVTLGSIPASAKSGCQNKRSVAVGKDQDIQDARVECRTTLKLKAAATYGFDYWLKDYMLRARNLAIQTTQNQILHTVTGSASALLIFAAHQLNFTFRHNGRSRSSRNCNGNPRSSQAQAAILICQTLVVFPEWAEGFRHLGLVGEPMVGMNKVGKPPKRGRPLVLRTSLRIDVREFDSALTAQSAVADAILPIMNVP